MIIVKYVAKTLDWKSALCFLLPYFFFFVRGLQVGKVFCGIWLNGPKGGGFRMGGRGVWKSHRCRCCCIDFSLPCCWFCRCCFRVNVIDHKANNKGALQGAAGSGRGRQEAVVATRHSQQPPKVIIANVALGRAWKCSGVARGGVARSGHERGCALARTSSCVSCERQGKLNMTAFAPSNTPPSPSSSTIIPAPADQQSELELFPCRENCKEQCD